MKLMKKLSVILLVTISTHTFASNGISGIYHDEVTKEWAVKTVVVSGLGTEKASVKVLDIQTVPTGRDKIIIAQL